MKFFRDIMQEWVETLRSKLREMKILSPRENLYTKLPEVRAPLLPTRDPTSPLPAPPPVPAAIVPGVERVIPPSVQQQQHPVATTDNETRHAITSTTTTSSTLTTSDNLSNNSTNSATNAISSSSATASSSAAANLTAQTSSSSSSSTTVMPHLTSMSNTLTQNLLNMLSDPISAYSEQLNDANSSSSSLEPDDLLTATSLLSLTMDRDFQNFSDSSTEDESIGPLLRKPSVNTSDLNTSSSSSLTNNSVRLDVLAAHRASAGEHFCFYFSLN